MRIDMELEKYDVEELKAEIRFRVMWYGYIFHERRRNRLISKIDRTISLICKK